MSKANGRSSVAGRRSNACDDSVGRPASTACASSATASCGPSPEVMVPSSNETAGRSLYSPARAASTSSPGRYDTSNERSPQNRRSVSSRAALSPSGLTRMRTFHAERTTATSSDGSAAPVASRAARTAASPRRA